jgi:predicted transcriptional regulator
MTRVLGALASSYRLDILKAVMEKPLTAGEIAEKVGFSATGQAYHHLNMLQAVGLLEQPQERGTYLSPGKRQVGLLLIMEGVRIILENEQAFRQTT